MRRKVTNRNIVKPDIKYGSTTLEKFINCIMWDGKKNTASDIFHEAIELVAKRTSEDGLEVWKKALANITPQVEVRSRRVGGATYQVPVEVRASRRTALAMRWLVDYSRKRGEKSMGLRLAAELVEASEGRGSAMKKREEIHRMAEANKAFAHFRY